ncbi:MAG TPA: 1,4-dihydroxy-6-naphthoate synthase [Oculatellaceae cyanobacterium]
MLKIAISPCPNDVFIFSGLILKKVQIPGIELQFEYFDIETLNEKALAQEFDLLKISYANYARCRDHYALLPSGGALGRGVGPLLLTGGNDWNPEKEVLVPGLYTTANFLLDFWAQRTLTKKFIAFNTLYDVLREKPDAQGVVIHEKRFTYAGDQLRLVQDLGSHWEEKTNCPIPLGCVIANKTLDAAAINDGIKQSLSWAYTNKEEALALCSRYASDMASDVIQAHIDLYVNEFSMDLGATGESAVKFFLNQVQSKAIAR